MGGQFDPPFLIFRRTSSISLQLYTTVVNLLELVEGKINAGISFFMLTLVYLQQGNVKKSKKLMTIVNIDEIFISWKMKVSMKVLEKMCLMTIT